jgi:hypothetical protein
MGGVAQLGEHLLCKQGVTGSIPVVSTTVVSTTVVSTTVVSSETTSGGNRLLANERAVAADRKTSCIADVPNSV